MTIQEAILGLLDGENLSSQEMQSVMTEIMEGKVPAVKVAAFLVLLRQKGEEVDEIFGAAQSILSHSEPVSLEGDPVDTCGTGGDSSGSFNISTIAAIIAHTCGVQIAKHGNRSISSRCGSADVLQTLGFKIDLPKEQTEALFKETGFVFLFAPIYHKAMKQVAPVRQELGIRTIFNMLGPLINPARTQRQMIGVYNKELTGTFTQVLRQFGSKHCIIVHGLTDEGTSIDEPSVCGPTIISELRDGFVKNYTIHPEDFGLQRRNLTELQGGDAEENARIVWEILDGRAPAAKEDAAVLAAGITCYVSGMSSSIKEGIDKARWVVKDGSAKRNLERMLERHRSIIIS